MSEVLKKFGRYFLMDLVAQGGMAEIYRARSSSADNVGRVLVIKRIQSAFGQNLDFVKMFRSEINVMMGFNHPNIVQLYDCGEEDGQPYIAMEYVDGKSLRQMTGRLAEFKKLMPVDFAAHIIEQVAMGLHYAHSFRDKITGQPLNIVHRDISPQNVIVSYEGHVKVIDFGIAKAENALESTRAGTIKGKPSYMAPEQISGEMLDGRADLFSLGAVLWELLVGKKLFQGDSDLAVLKLIESAQTYVKPPSHFNPDVPKEMDEIVMRALAKSRDKRFQTGEEFQRALHRFVVSRNPDFSSSEVSRLVKDLFKDEIVEDRKKVQKLYEKVDRLIQLDKNAPVMPSKPIPSAGIADAGEDSTIMKNFGQGIPDDGISMPSIRQSDFGEVKILEDKHDPDAQPKAKPELKLVPPPRGTPRYSSSVSERSAPGYQRPVPKKESSRSWVAVVLIGGLLYGGYWANQHGYFKTVEKKEVIPEEPVLEASKGQQNVQVKELGKSAYVKLDVFPSTRDARITIDGKSVDPTNPRMEVVLDTPLELAIYKSGYKPYSKQFYLDSRQPDQFKRTPAGLIEHELYIELEPLQFGFLNLKSTPQADVFITLDGQTMKKTSPIVNEKLPVGTYTIRMKNTLLGMEKTVNVTIEESKTVNREERLEVKP